MSIICVGNAVDGNSYDFGIPPKTWKIPAGFIIKMDRYPGTTLAEVIPEHESEAWTGTGLPPVGTVCEMRRTDYVDVNWQRVEFLCAGSKKAFFRDRDGHEWSRPLADLKFRPIRTPEQIAAEERDKAIRQMIDDTNILTGVIADRRIMAGQLYDEGYRKQVKE